MPKLLLALLLAAAPSIMAAPSTSAVAIAAQTDPAKLATLKGERVLLSPDERLDNPVIAQAINLEKAEKVILIREKLSRLS
jgi:hypothetical protein